MATSEPVAPHPFPQPNPGVWAFGRQTLDATRRHLAQNRAGLALPMDRPLGREPCPSLPLERHPAGERGARGRRGLVLGSMLLAPCGPLVRHRRDIAAPILVETHQRYHETPRNAGDASAGKASMRVRAWSLCSQSWPCIITTGGPTVLTLTLQGPTPG